MSTEKTQESAPSAARCYASMIGRQFLTPYQRSEGVVTVLAIHEPQYPFEVPLASVRFDGDHPAGYKDGTYGMYEAFMLRDLPQQQPRSPCAKCNGIGKLDGDVSYGDGVMAIERDCFHCNGSGVESN